MSSGLGPVKPSGRLGKGQQAAPFANKGRKVYEESSAPFEVICELTVNMFGREACDAGSPVIGFVRGPARHIRQEPVGRQARA